MVVEFPGLLVNSPLFGVVNNVAQLFVAYSTWNEARYLMRGLEKAPGLVPPVQVFFNGRSHDGNVISVD